MVLIRFKDGRDQKLGVKWTTLLFAHDNQVPCNMTSCSECTSSRADFYLRFWQWLCGVSFIRFDFGDDLVFCVSFNIVLVISMRCRGDKERCSEAPSSHGLHSAINEPSISVLVAERSALPTSDPFGDSLLVLSNTIFVIICRHLHFPWQW